MLVNDRQLIFDTSILTTEQAEEARTASSLCHAGIAEIEYRQCRERLSATLGRPASPDDVAACFQERIEAHRAVAAKESLIRFMVPFGVRLDDYDRLRQLLAERFGREPTTREVKTALWDSLPPSRSVYLQRAVDAHCDGLDPLAYKRAGALKLLEELQASGAKFVRVLVQSNACSACKELDGAVLSIDDAMTQMPIPCPSCTFGCSEDSRFAWCRCMYIGRWRPVDA